MISITPLAKDEKTKRLYEFIERTEQLRYFEGNIAKGAEKNKRGTYSDSKSEKESRKEIPSVVQRANESLRQAANHTSLVLHEDNRFLFWGGESYEIKQIVKDLELKSRNKFHICIAAHHGTYWYSSL